MPKRSRSTSASDSPVFHAPSNITDRASTFAACFLPLSPPESSSASDATKSPQKSTTGPDASRKLQALPDYDSASHRISAWRVRGPQRTISGLGVLELGHDDDGEKYGGKTLEKVLDAERVEGAVCVARWYGGVMLGPARFRHMEEIARAAIAEWRATSNESKRQKMPDEPEDDVVDQQRLVDVLKERDESVKVLRGLLAEKLEDSTAGSQTTLKAHADPKAAPAPAKTPEYMSMTVDVLKKLEKARDRTLAMLLKKLDEAEKTEQVG